MNLVVIRMKGMLQRAEIVEELRYPSTSETLVDVVKGL